MQKNPGAPTNLLNLSYDFAKVGGGTGVTGQLTKITNNLDPAKNRFYEYDALARLKTAKGGSTGTDWQQNYGYDRYGNRTSITKTGNAPLDAVNPGGSATAFNLSFTNGQGQTVNNRITTSGYQYDFAGNVTRGQDPDGNWQKYEYDAANRLKIVRRDSDNVVLATNTYGASNERLKTVDGASTNTWYLWEGGKVIAEYNSTFGAVSWAKSYVYLGERLLATESTTIATQFYHPDRLGTRLVTNASNGTSAGEQETLPFGSALGAGISGNNQRFTSYDRSTTTKLDYAVNRTYNAGLGRFTQVDPIGMNAANITNPQSLNLYGYCGNDPINHTDPQGLFFGAIIAAIAAVIGAIAGAIVAVAQVIWIYVLVPTINFIGGAMLTLFEAAPWLKPFLIPHFAEAGGAAAWKAIAFYSAVAAIGAVSNFTANTQSPTRRKLIEGQLQIDALKTGIATAAAALRTNKECKKLIAGPASSDPEALLKKLEKNERINYGNRSETDNIGSKAKISISKVDYNHQSLPIREGISTNDLGIAQGVEILHELSHATGKFGHEGYKHYHRQTRDIHPYDLNQQIHKICFGGK